MIKTRVIYDRKTYPNGGERQLQLILKGEEFGKPYSITFSQVWIDANGRESGHGNSFSFDDEEAKIIMDLLKEVIKAKKGA
ncbi:hypothetical protein KAR91_01755 [Candidatus Pacearchaeota archaeon]|nr:hypothetical protein [Candidatus Pacearchaeota archaeon]